MISPLGGSRAPPASEVEMHDRAGLLEIAAFVVILRNSTGGAVHCSNAELLRMKQIHTHGFCRVIAGATPRQCYVRFRSKADMCSAQADVR
jgi:hypothetical protein